MKEQMQYVVKKGKKYVSHVAFGVGADIIWLNEKDHDDIEWFRSLKSTGYVRHIDDGKSDFRVYKKIDEWVEWSDNIDNAIVWNTPHGDSKEIAYIHDGYVHTIVVITKRVEMESN